MSSLALIRQTTKQIIDLSAKSAILADKKSNEFCRQYLELERGAIPETTLPSITENVTSFLKYLCSSCGLKTEKLSSTINSLAGLDLEKNLRQTNFDKLNSYLKPEYYALFQSLGRVKDGVETLVNIRKDLINLLENKNNPEIKDIEEDLKIMNSVLKNLLSLWFSTGLLNIQRIDWNSPASLVEKVAHYESVHQIKTLSDLKKRLGPFRRCFIYTHSTMPYEPLVILHIALTNKISSNIKEVIKSSTATSLTTTSETNVNPNELTNAIFYSINSCQKGLQQVDLGNALIKSCVRLLLHELPNLKNFHTLSPIPKFKEWLDLKMSIAISSYNSASTKNEFFNLEKTLTQEEIEILSGLFNISKENKADLFENIKRVINSNDFHRKIIMVNLEGKVAAMIEDKFWQIIGNFLMRSCAFYLYHEKKNGYAFNSVCNFHLKNGAIIYRVNLAGDLSENGLKSSYGMMVNYGYCLDQVDSNCIDYLIEKKINASDLVLKYLDNFKSDQN